MSQPLASRPEVPPVSCEMEIAVGPCFLIEGELPHHNLLVGEVGGMGYGKGLFPRLLCLSYGNSWSGKDERSRLGWEGGLFALHEYSC